MKNFIQAIVIIVVAIAIYKSPIPTWLQGLLSEGAEPVVESSKASSRYRNDQFSFDDDELTSADEAKMLAAFEQGYQSPGDCGTGQTASARCELHRQRRLEEFRRQWRHYHQR